MITKESLPIVIYIQEVIKKLLGVGGWHFIVTVTVEETTLTTTAQLCLERGSNWAQFNKCLENYCIETILKKVVLLM